MYVQVIDLKRELDMTEQQLKAVQRKYNQLQREHSETTKTLTLSKLYLLPLYVLTPFVNPIHMYIYICSDDETSSLSDWHGGPQTCVT